MEVSDLWTPCSPGDRGAVEKGWMEVEPEKLLEAKVDMVRTMPLPSASSISLRLHTHIHTHNHSHIHAHTHTHSHSLTYIHTRSLSHTQFDMKRALEHTKPTVNKDDLAEIEKFTKEFGQES